LRSLLFFFWIAILAVKTNIRGDAWSGSEMILSGTAAALGSVKSMVNLASGYAAFGDLEQSRVLMLSALKRHQSADIYYNFGVLFLAQNDAPAAERDFQRCLSLKSDHPLCLLNLGVLLERKDELESAASFYEKCSDSSCRCRFNFGRLEFQRGNYNRSLEALLAHTGSEHLYLHSEYSSSERASYFSLLAFNFFKVKKLEQARNWLKRALAENPFHEPSIQLNKYL
jgi:tetratricopeptide (TPR) repeat protein